MIVGNTRVKGRETTPGVTQYRDETIEKYRQLIRERVGADRSQVPDIKGLKVSPPESYDGTDNIQAFEEWLQALLRYFRILKICGPALDEDRVLHVGNLLRGVAADWYNVEVEATSRVVQEWSFEDLICALYKRFMTEATAQSATDQFYAVRFNKTKGALAFYNDLQRFAGRMVERPDGYTMRRRFLEGLPHELVDNIVKSRGVSAEHSSMAELLEEARKMESALKFVAHHHQHQRNAVPGTSSQKAANPPPRSGDNRPTGVKQGVRFAPRPSGPYRPPPGTKPPPSEAKTERRQGDVRAERDNRNITCYACGQRGHFASDPKCPAAGTKPAGTATAKATSYAPAKPRVFAAKVEPAEEAEHSAAQADEAADDSSQADEEGEGQTPYEGEQYDAPEYALDAYEELQVGSEPDEEHESIHGMRVVQVSAMAEEGHREREFRTSLKRTVPRGSRPKREPQTHACIAAYMMVNGLKAYVLFDTGSTTDTISPEFARVANIPVFALDKPVQLQLGCIGSRASINFGANIQLNVGGVAMKRYVDIANIDRYDMIVGTPFMYDNKVVLDMFGRRVTANGVQLPIVLAEEEGEKEPTKSGRKPSVKQPKPSLKAQKVTESGQKK
jgi:hypothetical protein